MTHIPFNQSDVPIQPQDDFSPTADIENGYEGFGGGAPNIGHSNIDNDIPEEYRNDPELWAVMQASMNDV